MMKWLCFWLRRIVILMGICAIAVWNLANAEPSSSRWPEPTPEINVNGPLDDTSPYNVARVDRIRVGTSGERIGFIRGEVSDVDTGYCFLNSVMEFASIGVDQTIRKGFPEFINFNDRSPRVIFGTFVPGDLIDNISNENKAVKNDKVFIYIDRVTIQNKKILDFEFDQAQKIYKFKLKSNKLKLKFVDEVKNNFICPKLRDEVPDDISLMVNRNFSDSVAWVSLVKKNRLVSRLMDFLLLRELVGERESVQSALKYINIQNDGVSGFKQVVLASGGNVKQWEDNFNSRSRGWDKCSPDFGKSEILEYLNCSGNVRLKIQSTIRSLPDFGPIKAKNGVVKEGFLAPSYGKRYPPIAFESVPSGAAIYEGIARHGKITNTLIQTDIDQIDVFSAQKKGYVPCQYGTSGVRLTDEKGKVVGFSCPLERRK